MRIFDPKDQLGNSLLNSADTQKSSIKLEKKMEQTMGVGGEVVLTTTDVEDIENWEVSNAFVKENGAFVSFLPDCVRQDDGSLSVRFGTDQDQQDVIIVIKRVAFDGVQSSEEEEG